MRAAITLAVTGRSDYLIYDASCHPHSAAYPGRRRRASGAVVCSVLSPHPCVYRPFHQVCSVFRRRPCAPELLYPFSEQLQLTVESRDEPGDQPTEKDGSDRNAPEKLGTIREVFAALRSCWVPPSKEHSQPGTQLSVRLSFKRNGELFGKPRVTYATPGIPGE